MLEQLSPTSRAGIASRHRCHRLRPHDAQVRVIECHGDVLVWVMRTVDPVTDVGGGSQRLKSVQKPGRNVEVKEVPVVEQECPALPESRRPASYVDEDVVNRAVRAPDQFGLAEPRAAVHAADHSLCRSGLRVLHECGCRAWPADEFVEDGSVEGPGEQPAGVMNRLRYENCHTSEVGLFNSHGTMLP